MIRTIVADKTTALVTAQAVASALYAREKTGVGQHIKVAMLDAMISYLWPEAMMQYTVVGQEATANDPNARPDLIFQTLDGYMTVGTISDSEWQGFCRAVEQPALIEDKRFNTPAARTANASERIHLMGDILAKRTTADWLTRLDEADVPCAPVLRRGEVMHNEQVVARGSDSRVRSSRNWPCPPAQAGRAVRRHAVPQPLAGAGGRRARYRDPGRARLRPRGHRAPRRCQGGAAGESLKFGFGGRSDFLPARSAGRWRVGAFALRAKAPYPRRRGHGPQSCCCP